MYYQKMLRYFIVALITAAANFSCSDKVADSGGTNENAVCLVGKVLGQNNTGTPSIIVRLDKVPISDTTDMNGSYQLILSKAEVNNLHINLNAISDTIRIISSGNVAASITVTKWIDTLPPVYLIQRNIYGKLQTSDTNFKRIEAVIQELDQNDSCVVTFVKVLWFNTGTKGFSGFAYFNSLTTTQKYNIYVRVFDKDSVCLGKSRSIVFNNLAGDIEIPTFDPYSNVSVPIFAGKDTVVSINDSVKLNAQSTAVVTKWEWSIGGGKFVETSRADTVITVPKDSLAQYKCIVRAFDKDGNCGQGSITITVCKDNPVVFAGSDTTVSIRDSVYLHGSAKDAFGRIVLWEWSINGSPFVATSTHDTAFIAPNDSNPSLLCVLRATDDDGNTGYDTCSIKVVKDIPVVNSGKDTAVSINSSVPFHGTATQLFGTVVMYKWDFDGDNVYDDSSSTTGNSAHTYTHEATYHAKLLVRSNYGIEATGIRVISVRNAAPVINSIRQDTTISILDSIDFFATAVDSDGTIKKYAWDFDGNGVFEYESSTQLRTRHSYTTEGTYTAILKVQDDDNKQSLDSVKITVVRDKILVPLITGSVINFDVLHGVARLSWDSIPVSSGIGGFKIIRNITNASKSISKTDTIPLWNSNVFSDTIFPKIIPSDSTGEMQLSYSIAGFKTAWGIYGNAATVSAVVYSNRTFKPGISAGEDQTVDISSDVQLIGKVISSKFPIIKKEWKIGDSSWVAGNGIIQFRTNSNLNTEKIPCIYRVTDSLGTVVEDTTMVTKTPLVVSLDNFPYTTTPSYGMLIQPRITQKINAADTNEYLIFNGYDIYTTKNFEKFTYNYYMPFNSLVYSASYDNNVNKYTFFIFQGKYYLYNTSLKSFTSSDAISWTEINPIFSTASSSVLSGPISFHNKLYMMTKGWKLNTSTDGMTWDTLGQQNYPKGIVYNVGNKLVISNQNIHYSSIDEGTTWQVDNLWNSNDGGENGDSLYDVACSDSVTLVTYLEKSSGSKRMSMFRNGNWVTIPADITNVALSNFRGGAIRSCLAGNRCIVVYRKFDGGKYYMGYVYSFKLY